MAAACVLLKSDTDQDYVNEIITYLGTMGAIVSPAKCKFGTEVTVPLRDFGHFCHIF